MRSPNALVVDDDEMDRYLTRRVLTRSGQVESIAEFSGGADLLEVITDTKKFSETFGENQPATLLLLDINMPNMNGFEFLERIQALQDAKQLSFEKVCTVVMLTSSEYFGDREKAMAFDFVSDYIEKPISKEKLQRIIDQHYQGNPLK